jgi:vanillate O-demethylase monooxygenase subunit
MRNSLPPPSNVKSAGFQGRVDRCQEFEFVTPNTILQWTGATDAGTATDNPQHDFRFQFRLFHGLTPEIAAGASALPVTSAASTKRR